MENKKPTAPWNESFCSSCARQCVARTRRTTSLSRSMPKVLAKCCTIFGLPNQGLRRLSSQMARISSGEGPLPPVPRGMASPTRRCTSKTIAFFMGKQLARHGSRRQGSRMAAAALLNYEFAMYRRNIDQSYAGWQVMFPTDVHFSSHRWPCNFADCSQPRRDGVFVTHTGSPVTGAGRCAVARYCKG
jgi:hypothetical protein